MSGLKRTADPITRRLQAEASDPKRSAWVSANAGSGKTHVLVQRVVRLLLDDADPARLLCLTFTKAAAAEMAIRVFSMLGDWVRMTDAELDQTLEALESGDPSSERRARARRLFTLALETPGGLKILTVHAFCERLLHQFPFEAGIAGHFQVLEENAADVLIGEARRTMLGMAAADLGGPLGKALRTVVLSTSDRSHEDAIAELIEDRAAFHRWIASTGSLDNALAELRRELGVEAAPSLEEVEAAILNDTPFERGELDRLVELLQGGSANDRKAKARLEPYLHALDDKGRLAAYRDFFCKSDGNVRQARTLVTNSVGNAWPGLDERLAVECQRLEKLIEAANAAELYKVTAAVLRLAETVLAAYEHQKAVHGLLDFDDLINKTLDLLSRSGAAGWVHYKIDQGIDHILLDEAQDTSPAQWRVIRTLAEEFFAGEGAPRGARTLFAVGDEKQSIYSFQGAIPAWFSRVKRDIAAQAGAAGQPFSDVDLKVSFRSTPDIVRAIDKIFHPAAAHTGLASEIKPPVHEAIRRGETGMVVIWPMEPVPDQPEPGDWAEPLDHIGESAPEMVLATRIAMTIRSWLEPEAPARLEATGKTIQAGEILILTRKRGPLSEAINRSLKAAAVPVAGADRLALADHIAVKDLIALGDVVLQDRDELSLAAVLRSPLCGLSEDALFAIAYDRGPRPLWQTLKEAADAEPFAAAFRMLEALRSRADAVGPFAFYAEVLGPKQCRRLFAERLGVEADDILDEFLAQALAFERLQTPTLQGFLDWIRSTATEIRRETDSALDEVRVMTVHGAKGLEADVVFLVDDGSAPAHQSHDPNFIAITDDPDAAKPAPLVWARGTRRRPAAIKALLDQKRERAKQEYRRLLYVGATRARDRLYVCGTLKESTTDLTGGWHALVSSALLEDAEEEAAIDGSRAFTWRAEDNKMPPPTERVEPEPTARAPARPYWLGRSVAPARLIRSIKPSKIFEEESSGEAHSTLEARREGTEIALRRGQLIHRLLEALPEHLPLERQALADRYVAAVAPELSADVRTEMIGEALAVLEDPGFATVFAPGSRAEVDITAELEDRGATVSVSGRIDRLAVTAHEVMIVDYKTNRPAPTSLDSVPQTYLAQLALYTRVLGRIFPNRTVQAALLWTDIPALMPIPAESLASAAKWLSEP